MNIKWASNDVLELPLAVITAHYTCPQNYLWKYSNALTFPNKFLVASHFSLFIPKHTKLKHSDLFRPKKFH